MKSVEIIPRNILLDVFPLNLSVYKAIINDYITKFSKHNGVIWIGQFGNIGTPGISDIDILVLCEEENFKIVNDQSHEFVMQSSVYQYAFSHNVAVIPKTAIRFLYYFHSLENLVTLWGNSKILESIEQPDRIITLFRIILRNSYCWGELLRLCQQENVSLRELLLISKRAKMSVRSNSYFMNKCDIANSILIHDSQERQEILDAFPKNQADLAKKYFQEAVQAFINSDRNMNTWLIKEGFIKVPNYQRRIQLSPDHLVLLDNSYDTSIESFHKHIDKMHISYLPFFYAAFAQLIFTPFILLEPNLSKVINPIEAEQIEESRINEAALKWRKALEFTFHVINRTGGNPLKLIPFPFDLLSFDLGVPGPSDISSDNRKVKRMLHKELLYWVLARVRSRFQ